jgi:hypothetical protein
LSALKLFAPGANSVTESPHTGHKLSRRRRLSLIFGAALLGAVIGPMGFWFRVPQSTKPGTVSFPGSPERWGKVAAGLTAPGAGQLFLLIAFLATLAVAPFLIRYLERITPLPAKGFYPRAALAGVCLGIGASILTTVGLFMAALMAGSMNAPDPEFGVFTLFIGGLFFAFLAGVSSVFLFFHIILVAGALFGLLFGLLTRRLVG